ASWRPHLDVHSPEGQAAIEDVEKVVNDLNRLIEARGSRASGPVMVGRYVLAAAAPDVLVGGAQDWGDESPAGHAVPQHAGATFAGSLPRLGAFLPGGRYSGSGGQDGTGTKIKVAIVDSWPMRRPATATSNVWAATIEAASIGLPAVHQLPPWVP